MPKSPMYHHVGASLYFRISFMWISGFSLVLFRYCLHIICPWWRYVYTTRDDIAANDKPYDMAKVVLIDVSPISVTSVGQESTYLRNSGE